jgi:hypothetical protein
MRSSGVLLLLLLAGCHLPSVAVVRKNGPAIAEREAPSLGPVLPSTLENYGALLPTIDPRTAQPSQLSTQGGANFLGLTDDDCRKRAVANSNLAKLLERENDKPQIQLVSKKKPCPETTNEQLRAELRTLAATAIRNSDAATALERFYQLADAEGRTELLSTGMKAFDDYRSLTKRFREAGLPTMDDEELTRQRGKLLSDLERAEAGIRLLNVDLQNRLGLSVKGDERLWPSGDFSVTLASIDTEAEVAKALANRADLQFLRKLHLSLSVDTLPTINAQLQTITSLAGAGASPVMPWFPGSRLLEKRTQELKAQLRSAAEAEVAVRREQLFTLIADREKTVAGEVRASVVQMESAARRIALAKSTADTWQAKVDKANRDAKPFDRFPAELEWYRSRAEVLTEVMAWHHWRAKLRAATGELAGQ